MGRHVVVYTYRMIHDYGINPCAFTENYESIPELLTMGGCMLNIRKTIAINWQKQIQEDMAEIYLLAIAGHSNDECDRGKCCSRDKTGYFIDR